MLQNGIDLAQDSRIAHQSSVSSAMLETGLSAHYLTKLYQLRSNRIRVLIPPERKTGGDLEIHVKLPGSRWVGLIIQAKRVGINSSGLYYIPELSYRNGEQYKELMEYAAKENMLPMYMFYLPSKAVSGLTNRSGAMICNADALRTDISKKSHELRPLFPRLRKLSTILCCLEAGKDQEFVRKLFKMFCLIKTLGYSPRSVGDSSPPEYIRDFINNGTVPPSWLRSNLAGAAVIDIS